MIFSPFICHMKIFLPILSLMLCLFQGKAQSGFLKNQENIFHESTSQFIAVKLLEADARAFQCNTWPQGWIYPTAGEYDLLGTKIKLNESDLAPFKSIYFPNGDCQRFLSLMSLCDLYFPLFRKQCEDQSLHTDFRYFPLILSGCNQSYRSVNNQSGLWAMDYLVARRQHLRIDSLIDERNGGDFSSKAAILYLKELNNRYQGDPLRTILAYYTGVPFVENIPAAVSGQDLIDGLNPDARAIIAFYAYTKALIESARVGNHLNSYFDIQGQFDAIVPQQEIKKEALYAVLGSNKKAIAGMNPVYIGNTIPAGYRKVPFMLDKVESLKFEAMSDSVYRWAPPVMITEVKATEEVEEIIYYKVKKDDSLGKIAEKYHVTVKQIKKWNHLKSDRISKGKKLKIIRTKTVVVKDPAPKQNDRVEPEVETQSTTLPKPEVQPSVTNPLEEQIGKMEQQATACLKKKDYDCAIHQYEEIISLGGDKEVYEKKIAKARKDKKAISSTDHKITYTVKSGDSLWSIARKYPGVTEQDIMKWNKCNENIKPGQKLIIHTKSSSKSK